MMKEETLLRYAKIISNCQDYDDMKFVIEKMFTLYIPTEGEIKEFMESNYELNSEEMKSDEVYNDVKDRVVEMNVKLFQERFSRLDSQFDK